MWPSAVDFSSTFVVATVLGGSAFSVCFETAGEEIVVGLFSTAGELGGFVGLLVPLDDAAEVVAAVVVGFFSTAGELGGFAGLLDPLDDVVEAVGATERLAGCGLGEL